jgi:hypothetical protein
MANGAAGFFPQINPELGGSPNRRAALAALEQSASPQLSPGVLQAGLMGLGLLGQSFNRPVAPGPPVANLQARNFQLGLQQQQAAQSRLGQLIAQLQQLGQAPAMAPLRQPGFGQAQGGDIGRLVQIFQRLGG